MNRKIINNPLNLNFEPFDNYGEPIKGMSWYKISYKKEKELEKVQSIRLLLV